MTGEYWQDAASDAAMQDEHGFIWNAMLDTIDIDLAGTRVLDAGCNRGGFLRLLADRCGIDAGFGYDPAAGAIDDARRLAGDRPLQFEASATVPEGWTALDVAFSHEVLYLVRDMPAHAQGVFGALRPGGVYFAVMGVHRASPLMVEWHDANVDALQLPPLYDIDSVVGAFRAEGFLAAASRLAMRFVPAVGHGQDGRLAEWLDYYSADKLLLRFARPE